MITFMNERMIGYLEDFAVNDEQVTRHAYPQNKRSCLYLPRIPNWTGKD